MTQLSTAQVVAGSQADDVIVAGGASQSPPRDYVITFNGIFPKASIVNAEGVAELPQRDFLIVAGDSDLNTQEYIIAGADRLRLGAITSLIYLDSRPIKRPDLLETCVIGISSTDVKTAIPLEASAIAVDSEAITFWPLKWLAPEPAQVSVESSQLETYSLACVSHQSLEISVIGVPAWILYLENGPDFYFADIAVGSGLANLGLYLGYKIERCRLGVASGSSTLARQLLIIAPVSEVSVESYLADLKDNRIYAIPYVIGVGSPQTYTRFIPNGVLPGIVPENRIFSPQAFGIRKFNLAGGRIHRQLLCSARSKATLQLEYTNISTYDAKLAVRAFDMSYGTRYGFELPEDVFTGADEQLIEYYKLNDKGLKWYYAQRPTVTFVRKGLANLSVSLQARIDK